MRDKPAERPSRGGSAAARSIGRFVRTATSANGTAGIYAGLLAYWIACLILNSDAHFVIERSVRLPLIALDIGLRPFFLVFPALGILAHLRLRWSLRVRSGPDKGTGSGRDIPRFVFVFGRATLPLVLVDHFIKALRLHDNPSTYAVGGLWIAGTLAALFLKGNPSRPRPLPFWRAVRSSAALLVIVFEALLIWKAVPWAKRGYYPETFKPALLRPLLQPFLSVDLTGLDLTRFGGGLPGRLSGGPDLSGAYLEGARLLRVKAGSTNFRRTWLREAVLDFSDLEHSNFRGTDLLEARLNFVRARGADFSRCYATGIRSIGSDFRQASLRKVWMFAAKWIYIDARGSDWSGANFRGSAEIFDSNFQGARLVGVNLSRANLMRSDFSDADLEGTDLRGTSLWHTEFRGANLSGADLRGSDADVDQLGKARTLYGAKMDPQLYEAVRARYPRLLEKPATPSRN